MDETLQNKYMELVHSIYEEPYEPVVMGTFDDKHEKEMMQVTGVTGVMKKKVLFAGRSLKLV